MRALTSRILAILVLAGCNQEVPAVTAPTLEGASMSRRISAGRPLTGRCETEFNAPPLPPPPVHRQTDTGTCQLAHLGRVVFHSVKDIHFATGTQTTREATFTAANGDILRATGTGTSRVSGPGRVSFAATLILSGGTGRFTGASGEAHVEGVADLGTRTATFTIVSGWLAYDASDRGK